LSDVPALPSLRGARKQHGRRRSPRDPVLAAGGVDRIRFLAMAEMLRSDAWKRGWLIVAATLTVFAFVFFLTLLGKRSAVVLFDWHILFVVIGCVFLIPVAVLIWLRSRSRIEKLPLLAACGGLFGLAFVSYGLWQIAGDFLLPLETVEATVTGLKADVSRSGPHYHVYLNGKHHPTTADVHGTLQVGDQIRASVSMTSGTIFGVEYVAKRATTAR
jgi:hypothetical protein